MDTIYDIILENQSKYVNSGDIDLDDGEFDAIVNLYEEKTGNKLNLIGAPVIGDSIKLPHPMPSLDKAKGTNCQKRLKKFLDENPGPYLKSDKHDGSGIEIIYDEGNITIITGGDGDEGKDASFLVPYLNLPQLDFYFVVRGELDITKKDFKVLESHLKKKGNKAKNSRNTVNGIVNGKKSQDTVTMEKCKFYAFNILSEVMSIDKEFEMLKDLGFNVPDHRIIYDEEIDEMVKTIDRERASGKSHSMIEDFTDNELSDDELGVTIIKKTGKATREEALERILFKDLKIRNKIGECRIDGLVIVSIPNSELPKELNENPSYAIAYKVDTFVAGIVKDMQWRITSRYGYITPVAVFDPPIEILGVTVKYATAHNARFVMENNISVDSVVVFTLGGDIIPKIVSCITPGEKECDGPEIECHPDDNGVELVLDNLDCKEVHVARILHFVKTLKIKSCGKVLINKMYDAGITTIEKFIRVKQDFVQNLERMGEVSAGKVIRETKEALERVSYPIIMFASCIFGELIGDTILESFISAFPMWDVQDITYEDIIKVKGFGPVKSRRIADALPLFKEWLEKNPMCYPKIKTISVEEKDLVGHTIVCTGFTMDEALKQHFIARGAIVKPRWVVGATILIAKKISSSNKFREATEKGIPIVPLDDIDNIVNYLN